jgi:hypothetical protein
MEDGGHSRGQVRPRRGLATWPRAHNLVGLHVAILAAGHSQTWEGAVKSSGKEVSEVENEGNLDIFSTFSLPKTEK